jgi:hypothetical protein
MYNHLIDIEAVFRSLKSELELKPIYHQKELRIESHLFITVLAYQCVQMIRLILKNSCFTDNWSTIRHILTSHGRLTIIIPNEDGGYNTIRKTCKPNVTQAAIYQALRITNLPGEIIDKKIQYLP